MFNNISKKSIPTFKFIKYHTQVPLKSILKSHRTLIRRNLRKFSK